MKPSRIIFFLIAICCCAVFSSCTRQVSFEHTEIALGTYVKTIVIAEKGRRGEAQAAVESLYEMLASYENVYDYRSTDGQLHRFNTRKTLRRSDHAELFDLVVESLQYAELTRGFFDPTILPLMKLWGFDDSAPHLPEPELLAETIELVGYRKVSMKGELLIKPELTKLDLSGIAKGKFVDAARDTLRDAGFDDFLVDAGGDIYVSGRNLNGGKWRVAIQDPVHRDTYSGILEKSDAAIVTSGDYENFFEEQGTRYSHLLNPFTGYPDSDIRSVTIIAHETAFGDAVATAVFAMGSSEGFQFLLDEGIEGYIIYGDDAQSVSTPRFWD